MWKRPWLSSGLTRTRWGSLLKVNTCHPGSLIIMVIKTTILGSLFFKAARLLWLSDKKYLKLSWTICITSKTECDPTSTPFFTWHLFCSKASVRWCTVCMVSKLAFKIQKSYNPNGPISSKLKQSCFTYWATISETLFLSFSMASRSTDPASPCLWYSFKLYLQKFCQCHKLWRVSLTPLTLSK